MPKRPTDSSSPPRKFDSFALLRPTDQQPKGQPFTPVPHFFLDMWKRYESSIPLSFWATFMFLLRDTLGRTLTGASGKVAQSQFPVDDNVARLWLSAITAFGGLVDVEKATYRDSKGSKYTIHLEASEDHWRKFFALLALGCRLGYFSNSSTPRPTAKRIEELFSIWSNRPDPQPQSLPCWSLMILRTAANPDCGFAKAAEGIDIWDDKNWIARGFDVKFLNQAFDSESDEAAPEFSHLDSAEFFQLLCLFHAAWTNCDSTAETPRLPEESLSHAAEAFGFDFGTVSFQAQSVFRVVEIDGEACLENDWLTAGWRRAKEDAAINASLQSKLPKEIINAEM